MQTVPEHYGITASIVPCTDPVGAGSVSFAGELHDAELCKLFLNYVNLRVTFTPDTYYNYGTKEAVMMKYNGKRISCLLLAVLLTFSAAVQTVPAAAYEDTDSGTFSADASGDASGDSSAEDTQAEDDADPDDTDTDSELILSEETITDEAAAYSSYSYSYSYTSLKSVTLTPSSETVSAVSTALISFITSMEGDYDSVNCDDNGALSIGIFQWHGANALTLMRLIVSADNATAYSKLGSSLYSEIISSSTSWSSRTLTSAEATKIANCISTSTGTSIQDKLAASYAASYINAGTTLGLRNASAIFIYADVYNQRGSSGAKTTAAAAADLAGSYSAVTGNEMLIASIACYSSSSSIYQSFVKRRLKAYQYTADAGWTYKLDADYLIPSSQTAAESTAVKWIQHTLNVVSSSSLTINGTYDSATAAAVKVFQSAQGLTADGEVGPYTIAALCTALYDYMTANGYTTASLLASSVTSTTAASTLKISSYNYPTTIKKGNSYSLKGTITSNYKITKVTVKVLNSSGKTVLSASASPNTKSYKIQTALDAKIKFAKLSAGTYTYKVTATDTQKTKTLVSKTFKVRSLTISSTRYPTSIKKGKSFTIKGTIKSSYKITKVTVQVLDSSGNVVLSASAKPNKKSYKIQTKLDAKIKFGTLSKGTYTYKVIASDTKTSNVTLLKKTFKVK